MKSNLFSQHKSNKHCILCPNKSRKYFLFIEFLLIVSFYQSVHDKAKHRKFNKHYFFPHSFFFCLFFSRGLGETCLKMFRVCTPAKTQSGGRNQGNTSTSLDLRKREFFLFVFFKPKWMKVPVLWWGWTAVPVVSRATQIVQKVARVRRRQSREPAPESCSAWCALNMSFCVRHSKKVHRRFNSAYVCVCSP